MCVCVCVCVCLYLSLFGNGHHSIIIWLMVIALLCIIRMSSCNKNLTWKIAQVSCILLHLSEKMLNREGDGRTLKPILLVSLSRPFGVHCYHHFSKQYQYSATITKRDIATIMTLCAHLPCVEHVWVSYSRGISRKGGGGPMRLCRYVATSLPTLIS